MDRKLDKESLDLFLYLGSAFSEIVDPQKANLILPRIRALREELKCNYGLDLPLIKVSDEKNLPCNEVEFIIRNKISKFKVEPDVSDDIKVDFIISKLRDLFLEQI